MSDNDESLFIIVIWSKLSDNDTCMHKNSVIRCESEKKRQFTREKWHRMVPFSVSKQKRIVPFHKPLHKNEHTPQHSNDVNSSLDLFL